MGEIVTFFFFVSAAVLLGGARVAHRHVERSRNTREWIAFLEDDLAGSAL